MSCNCQCLHVFLVETHSESLTSTSRRVRPKVLRKDDAFLHSSSMSPTLLSKAHSLANRYTRKSNTEIVLARMKSRYGFFVTDKRGAESSVGIGVINAPNQDKFFSWSTWKKVASSS